MIAVNALRPGGSQTYAFMLASLLQNAGFNCVLVGKRGIWSASASKVAETVCVRWREGTSLEGVSLAKKIAFALAHTISAMQLSLKTRHARLIIASQPGPTAFVARWASIVWPKATVSALVHGTTDVEWPFLSHQSTIRRVDYLFAATPEAQMKVTTCTSRPVSLLGNLFDASVFWDGVQNELIASRDPDGAVLFLGTLTPNKTAPLKSLISAMDSSSRNIQVVGGGPELLVLQALVASHGVSERVEFVGSVADPRAYIRDAGVVMTAGRGALEAMSIGRPTIIANTDGFYGLASSSAFEKLTRHNFTGRTPGSGQPSIEAIVRALYEASFVNESELREIAKLASMVGSIETVLGILPPASR